MNPTRRGTPDFILLALTFLLVGFGTVMVFSSSSAFATIKYNDALYLAKKHVVFVGIGIIAMLVTMNIRYVKLKKVTLLILVATLAALIYLLFATPPAGLEDVRRWISLGERFGTVQPSEFAKLVIILYLAALIHKKGENFRDFQTGLLPALLVTTFMALLIARQPDLGTAVIFLAGAFVVIVVGGANLKHLFYLFVSAATTMALFIAVYMLTTDPLKHNYQIQRLTAYLDPWAHEQTTGWHLIRSLYAFGHGGLTGTGLGQSIQKLHYLPEAYNDFIFAIIGEEFGFAGASLFVLIYLCLLWRGLIVAIRCPDRYGSMIGIGIVSMLGFQAFVNIGGVTGAIPITGAPLPLISYGGSSMIVCLISIGILLSISREYNRINHGEEATDRSS